MKLKKFNGVLNAEIKASGLVKADVEHCLSLVYHTYSEAVYGNNEYLILKHDHYSDNQITVPVLLLKMQQQWVDPFFMVRSAFASPIVQLMA